MRRPFRRLYILYFCCLVSFVIIIIYEGNSGIFCTENHLQPDVSKASMVLKHLQDQIKFESMKLKNMKKQIDHEQKHLESLPWIYVITPTYSRPVQKAELTRLSNTFLHVKNLHWIVVEDDEKKTPLVSKFLMKSGLSYTHLNILTPPEYKLQPKDPNWLKPRGVLQRNKGLEWIRTNIKKNHKKGVVYFADDDNTYSLQLFEEMRHTKKVSVWPVGLVGKLLYEAPVVKGGKVAGWRTYWKPNRPFPMDMAGFAIDLNLMLENPSAQFKHEVPRGYLESILLQDLVTMEDLEPKANSCTKIFVWHTRTEKVNLKNEKLIQADKAPDPRIEI